MTDRRRGRWLQTVSRRLAEQQPFCPVCEAAGILRLATETDHKIPLEHGGEDNETNMQRLCKEHHREKTARDRGYRRRVAIGPDGWPMAEGGRSHAGDKPADTGPPEKRRIIFG